MTTDDPKNTARQGTDRHLRTIAGRQIYFDWDDFLWSPEEWDEALALALAREIGLATLDKTQWKVLHFMRDFYFYHGRSPMNKDLKAGTNMSLTLLEKLFPGGIRSGARRLAGLPNPKACI